MSKSGWPRLIQAMIALLLALATLTEVAVVAGSFGQEAVSPVLRGRETACADAFFTNDETYCIVQ